MRGWIVGAVFVPLVVGVWSSSCVGRGVEPRAKRPEPIVSPAGTQIPTLGLAFDVSYDGATDELIRGYRILNVGITNNSLQIVPLDPFADRWWVIDRNGHKHEALVGLRRSDPDVWAALPVGLKKLIEYPLMVPIGSTQSVDLLFPARVNLREFHGVIFRSIGLDREIRIYARDAE